VQVTVVQSFGSRWLMPRLTKFTAREPEIEVRIDASPVLADLARDPFDLAIREGRGGYPEADSVRLFPLEFVPVATPAVLRKLLRRDRTVDWTRARLLHEVSYDYWPDWTAMAGVGDVDVARGLFFSHTMLALDAACEGQGVALAPLPLAGRELAAGTLAVVAPRAFAPGSGIYLAWPRKGLRTLSPAATAFRDWLIEEARAEAPPAPRVPRPRRRAS
jgi:LysR family glycine cleavage system transcriptional activator